MVKPRRCSTYTTWQVSWMILVLWLTVISFLVAVRLASTNTQLLLSREHCPWPKGSCLPRKLQPSPLHPQPSCRPALHRDTRNWLLFQVELSLRCGWPPETTLLLLVLFLSKRGVLHNSSAESASSVRCWSKNPCLRFCSGKSSLR